MNLTEVLEQTKLSQAHVDAIQESSEEGEIASMFDFIKSAILKEKAKNNHSYDKDARDSNGELYEELTTEQWGNINKCSDDRTKKTTAHTKTAKTFSKSEIIEKQKRIAASILYTLASEGNPKAIIAGGAPRNWFMGEPANDIDIYFPNQIDKEVYQKIANREQLTSLGKSYGKYGQIKNIKSVVETNVQETKIQFITIDKFGETKAKFADQVFESFDFNICKIAWTPDGYITSPEFSHDMANKKLTIDIAKVVRNSGALSLPERLRKMKKYYPNHELDIV